MTDKAAIRRNKEGTLTDEEKRIAKALLADGWRNQDILALFNIGREFTTNSGRITGVKQDEKQAVAAPEEVELFVKKKQSYDYQTGLNLYDDERIIRAREAMALAVHVFNSPGVRFKTELFAVNAVIAWTYGLHEFYLRSGVAIEDKDGRSLLLSQMLKRQDCPISKTVCKNLEDVSEIRNEVEHKLLRRSDFKWFGLFQACCLNFDTFLRQQFGERASLGSDIGVAIQFSALNIEQIEIMQQYDVPPYISALDARLEEGATEAERQSLEYQFRVVYTLTSATKSKKHIRFIRPDSEHGQEVHNVLIKEKPLDELYPFRPARVAEQVQKKAKKRFSMHDHSVAWQRHKARPAGNSKSPEQTNKDYCVYHKAHGDYTYSQKWVDLLVKELADATKSD